MNWPRHGTGWLPPVLMVAAGAAYVVLRMATPSDGTHVSPGAAAWTDAGVTTESDLSRRLVDGDLVTAVGGVTLERPGGWRGPAPRAGDRLTYRVVRDGRALETTVALRQTPVTGQLLAVWGTILFVVVLFGVTAYLYARRANRSTAALLVLGGGLLGSTLTLHAGVPAVAALGGPVLWLYLVNTQVVYVVAWSGGLAFALLFPRPWPPLARHRWLLPAVSAAPLVVLLAWALAAAAGGGSLTGWVGQVVAAEATVVVAVVAVLLAALLVRLLTTTDPMGRQQLRWLGGGGGLSAVMALLGWFLPERVTGASLLPAEWLGFTGLPLVAGMAVAVLRHRLFDLDRVVSRTLAYALLTLVLGLAYTVVVLGLGQLLGRAGSSLAVAAATLAVAAAFQPARRRIQDLVDRRFNRRRYDAARTIQAFSGRLRQQVDLDTLTAELLTVVGQTMQPTRAALWLRPASRTSTQDDG